MNRKSNRFGGALVWLCVVMGLLSAGCSRQARVERHLKKGEEYFVARNYQGARIEYANALKLDRTNTVAARQLGESLFQLGELKQAVPLLMRARQFEPGNVSLRLRVGSIYVMAHQFSKAREELLWILERQPTNAEAVLLLSDAARTGQEASKVAGDLIGLEPKIGKTAAFQLASGNVKLKLQDLDGAEAAFRLAMAADPKSGAGQFSLGLLYWARRNLSLAETNLKAGVDLSPPSSPRRLRYSDFLVATGKPAEARGLLEEMTVNAPDVVAAWVRLADLELAERKFAEAESHLQKGMARDKDNHDGLLVRARLGMAQGKFTEAAKDAGLAAGTYPQSVEALYRLAQAELLGNELVKAVATLDRALKLEPTHEDSLLLQAQVNLARGDVAPVVVSLNGLLKRNPASPQGQMLLVSAYRAQDRDADALGVLQGYMKMYPKDPRAPVQAAGILLEQKRTAEGRKLLENAAQVAPRFLPAIDALVTLDLRDKNFAAAEQRARQLVESESKAAEPRLLLARVQLAQGRPAEAESTLEQAIKLEPDFRQGYLALAQLALDQKQPREAIDYAEALTRRDPKDVGGHMVAAVILGNQGKQKEARDHYEAILKVNPKFVPALNNLAYLLSTEFQDLSRASQLAQSARQLAPRDPHTADTAGWVLHRQGDHQRAATLFQEAHDGLPNQPEVLHHLALARYAMGQTDAARTAFRQALALGKDYPGKAEAQQRLAVLEGGAAAPGAVSIPDLEKLAAQQPSDIVLLTRLGEACETAGRVDQARASYEKALGVNSRAVAPTIGLARLNAGPLKDPAKAMQYAKAARTLAPGDPAVGATLGRIAYQAGDHPWSASLLQECSRQSASDPEIQFDLALASYAIGRIADADQAIHRTLPAKAGFSRAAAAAAFAEALTLTKSSQAIAQGIGRIAELQKSNPELPPVQMAIALAFEQKGQMKEARASFEAILARFPGCAPAMARLARLLAADPSNDARAYELARNARNTLSSDSDLALTLGQLAYRKSEFPYVTTLMQEVIRGRPKDPQAHYWLGLSLVQAKKVAEGRQALQKAVDFGLTEPLLGQARKTIAEAK